MTKGIFYKCACGACDFCSRKKITTVIEVWQKAERWMNSNQDLHICRYCLDKMVQAMDNADQKLECPINQSLRLERIILDDTEIKKDTNDPINP